MDVTKIDSVIEFNFQKAEATRIALVQFWSKGILSFFVAIIPVVINVYLSGGDIDLFAYLGLLLSIIAVIRTIDYNLRMKYREYKYKFLTTFSIPYVKEYADSEGMLLVEIKDDDIKKIANNVYIDTFFTKDEVVRAIKVYIKELNKGSS